FTFTLQAFGLTLLLSAPWPLLLATVGWQLDSSLEHTVFSKAVSQGILWLTPAFFYLLAFRVMCEPGGLAAAHFRWPKISLQLLRREINRLIMVFLPAAFVAILFIRFQLGELGGGIERLAFIVVLIAFSVFLYHLFVPKKGVLHGFLTRHRTSLFARLRYLWLTLALALPLLLAGLALSGYLYTAATLTGRLIETLWLILGLIVFHQLSVRWLLLTRRKLALEAALERQEAARAAEKQQVSASPGEEDVPVKLEEPEVNLTALSLESRKLLDTTMVIGAIIGLWLIWSVVLPAFGQFGEIVLWHSTDTVAGEEKLANVTMADAVLAMLIAIVTLVAMKRLPALLEIILLKRLDIPLGSRYTATTLSGYFIAATGILVALDTIGASWSQIQWLAAALSVGIGFGLQEIVANFISGIIILFERPIRVGDFVTVGDTDGHVTRIRIRATTIQTRDRKELLVPNKEFITGRLLNWSLSDQMTRIILPVGIGYGSNVKLAMSLMREVAIQNERVLKEPEPRVIFESFGDNALTLTLRCFIESVDYR
ncbi:MAG: mechanosensitive ion channel, partial [Gammaproteobacteria bacterium]|nr:mechanosensitive ion channel [Gammaproteobacteria bacterium]